MAAVTYDMDGTKITRGFHGGYRAIWKRRGFCNTGEGFFELVVEGPRADRVRRIVEEYSVRIGPGRWITESEYAITTPRNLRSRTTGLHVTETFLVHMENEDAVWERIDRASHEMALP